MSHDREVQIRYAENQSLYRVVNERIESLNDTFEVAAALSSEWFCECADPACVTKVTATAAEYEAVRANPRTFIVYPGHVYPEVEHVVRGNERFTVVEKDEAAGEVAEQKDPRGARG